MTTFKVDIQHLRASKTFGAGRAAEKRRELACRSFELFGRLTKGAPVQSFSHMADHSSRMFGYIGQISKANGLRLDQRVIIPAVALHDVGVFYTTEMCHGPESARIVRPHLDSLGLNPIEVERVCSVIRAHDDPTFADISLESRALRIADSRDAFGAFGVYRFLEVYHRRGMTPPVMFTKALESLDKRWGIINDPMGYFHELFEDEYVKAKEIMLGLWASSSFPLSPGYYNDVYIPLKKIDFDVYNSAKLEKLIADAQNPFAKEFFQALRSQLFPA